MSTIFTSASERSLYESNSLYKKFAANFAASSLSSLIESFNRQVGNRGWNSARAAHDRALIVELDRRGIDISAVHRDGATSFKHHVALEENRLVTID